MPLTRFTAEELFSQLPEPAILMQVNGDIVAANPLAAELFEIKGAFAGVNVLDLLTQPERTRLNPLAWMEKWATAEYAPEIEYVYLICRTHKGIEKQLSVRVSRLVKDGTYYLVMLRDISVSEARFRAERLAHRIASRILAISADAIVTTNEALIVTQMNASAEQLFGYQASEVLGKSLDMLMPAQFRSHHASYMRRFAQEDKPARLMGERAQVLGLSKTGVEIPLEASITRLKIEGQIVFSAHLRDVRRRGADLCRK